MAEISKETLIVLKISSAELRNIADEMDRQAPLGPDILPIYFLHNVGKDLYFKIVPPDK